MHLHSIEINEVTQSLKKEYPFRLPLILELPKIDFTNAVTFFVGENGTGKSTLLESIAVTINSTTIGAVPVSNDPTLAPAKKLSKYMKPKWTVIKKRGFFLRSEDFFNFVKEQTKLRAEMLENIEEVNKTYQNRSILAQNLAKMPYLRELHDIESKYGEDLDANSHGESFLQVFSSRIVPNGLYLLDEPEAALSPMRQLALIAMIKDAVAEGSQFIIATHSPILLAFPDASILSFDDSLAEVSYDELEHVKFTKAFLDNPAQFLRHL